MHHLLSPLLCLSVLYTSAIAVPAKRDVSANGYGKIFREIAGPATRDYTGAVDKTYRKYQWTSSAAAPERLATNAPVVTQNKDVISSAGGKGAGEAAATPQNHYNEYLVPVSIGGQTLMLDVDTGSSDLWVFNSEMPTDRIGNHTAYNPSQSKTASTIPGASFGVAYGDKSNTTGNVGTETVTVGGIIVSQQAIELPTSVSDSLFNDTSDGILGLGFRSINGITPTPQPTWFENALSNLNQKVFTANLKDGTAGNYEFGTIDHTAFSGSITYTPVDKTQGLWSFSTTSFAVGSGATQTHKGSPGIADTGSSLLLLDDAIVNAYWGQVSGTSSNQQGHTFPCKTSLPDFHVALGTNYMATISGSLLNYSVVDQPGYCFGGIQSNSGQGLNVFGDIMFRSQFVVFDYENLQIGFAPHA